MRGKWFFFFLAVAVMIALACTRSASTPMPTSALPTQVNVQPQSQADMDATATAMYQALLPTSSNAQEAAATPSGQQPQPAVQPTPTPLPPPTPTPAPTTVAPPPSPTAAPTASHTVPDRYTLHWGEHPFCLARRFNIHPDDLLRANGLTRGQIVYPGQTLVIPKDARPFTAFAPNRARHPHPTIYTVRPGDTIYSIACYFGDVWPEDIARENGLPLTDDRLTPGMQLRIP
ncbi:MAG: LysM peptidoglycan-binding domain-containing protein [Chloroflexi bacterium]|nr:LysM peptidoglycan-binding domain-containing protein [Chloroflexota bacterium]